MWPGAAAAVLPKLGLIAARVRLEHAGQDERLVTVERA